MKKRVLSGHRVTGKIHIGNLYGSLLQWVKLQDKYECFYEIADLHALTTNYEHTEDIKSNIREIVIDWLACGLSPEKSTLFIQSTVPEHCELHLLLSMLVPVPWLQRNPTLKEQIRDLNLQGKVNYGLLGYPVLQSADILAYKAHLVPVGEDQLSHIEITREIARKFNSIYKPIFPEPESLLSKSPRVPGIDGRKMSKSLNNEIFLNESPETTKEKIKQAFTDPLKIHKHDKGHPDGCVVFAYHKLVAEQEIDELREFCIEGRIGCVECKEKTAELLNATLVPYREACNRWSSPKSRSAIDEILEQGSSKARSVAQKTLSEVKSAMNLW